MPVFGGILPEVVELILAHAEVVSVDAGGYFFEEGARGGSMFVLEAGRVEVIKLRGEQEFLLTQLERGDCFGEMSVIDLCPRSASVRAVENSTAIELSNTTFRKIFDADLEQFTMIQMNMGRELSRRLRRADEMLLKVLWGDDGPAEGDVDARG
jgi:CRP-like cAMP-binding protein